MAKPAENVTTNTTDSEWNTVAEPYAPSWDFDQNPELIGTFVEHRVVEQDDLNKPGEKRDANVYEILAADTGEKVSVWGSYVIDEAFANIATGTTVRIVFHGEEDIKGGRSVKKFTVQTKK